MARVSPTRRPKAAPTPYVELDRAAWSRLRENQPMSLEHKDLARLRGLDRRQQARDVGDRHLARPRGAADEQERERHETMKCQSMHGRTLTPADEAKPRRIEVQHAGDATQITAEADAVA